MHNKGFTLIELLVIIAIIAILVGIVVGVLLPARLKAKDAAVISSVASYRTQAQLVFAGDFTGLCASSSFAEIEDYILSQGAILDSCEDYDDYYRVVIGLPSAFAVSSFPARAYAAGEDGYCINSLGDSRRVILAEVSQIEAPSCTRNSDTGGVSTVPLQTAPTYQLLCEPSCSGRKCLAESYRPACYETNTAFDKKNQITSTQVDLSLCTTEPVRCSSSGTIIP
ncbi:prepilin-type N-terminal cleavage/methylation domain-containing protein [Candidatus Nomurabacteria bacterium]|nr:prepilin-type N-terminal cleavage/methylation domain-containing protein [Candidatus Nomurabacteria bacterium]